MAFDWRIFRTSHRNPAGSELDRITAYCGGAMRGVVGVVAAAAGLLGAAPPVSFAWLGPAIAIELAWTAVFVWAALRRRRLASWPMACDIAVTIALCLTQAHLVSNDALPGGASWVAAVTTMTIVCANFTWRPHLGVPAGGVVALAYLAGVGLAGATDGIVTAGIHLVQITATATLMTLLRTQSAVADDELGRLRNVQRAEIVRRERRADERAQNRRVHDTALATLTVIGTGGIEKTSLVLRDRAAADLADLEHMAATAQPPAGPVLLDERLRALIARSGLRIKAELTRCTVPWEVGEAFAGAAAEALGNVARHAGVDTALLRMTVAPDEVLVEVVDEGRGFDPGRVPPHRYGLRESIEGRMRGVDGSTEITSGPGGTRVALGWRP
ncbi:sensor histidine kinase [Microbispora sp. H13382]|uniref:sensor histidine kinase n=1 Tax=Microbispora sp. H13382 TaxID=2729112 RepID=UPI0016040BD6|nr:ATP-binding protein [Microbispora sp. H13382]